MDNIWMYHIDLSDDFISDKITITIQIIMNGDKPNSKGIA